LHTAFFQIDFVSRAPSNRQREMNGEIFSGAYKQLSVPISPALPVAGFRIDSLRNGEQHGHSASLAQHSFLLIHDWRNRPLGSRLFRGALN
jgi:hypothetical protein